MLVRELAARYLGEGGTVRVDADPKIVSDLGRAGPVADLQDGADPVPGDVALISVDPFAYNLAERLALVTRQGVTVLLLLPVEAGDLPVGRLAQAARTARMAFVEMAPIESDWSLRTVVVCQPSSGPVPVRPFLSDDSAAQDEINRGEIDLDAQSLRIGWEWGLGDARSRALEELERAAQTRISELEAELAAVRQDLEAAGKDLESAQGVAERSERRATAEAQRRSALQQSPSFLVGRAVVTSRRHPLRGGRQLLGALRRSLRG
jgi:hypothetical protein